MSTFNPLAVGIKTEAELEFFIEDLKTLEGVMARNELIIPLSVSLENALRTLYLLSDEASSDKALLTQALIQTAQTAEEREEECHDLWDRYAHFNEPYVEPDALDSFEDFAEYFIQTYIDHGDIEFEQITDPSSVEPSITATPETPRTPISPASPSTSASLSPEGIKDRKVTFALIQDPLKLPRPNQDWVKKTSDEILDQRDSGPANSI